MGQDSKIEWTHHTFNPWMGCQKVSAGCAHCYAETMMDHRYGKVKWGPNGTRQRTADSNWKQPRKWHREARAAGERKRVFCASLADVFEDRSELKPWRRDLFELIENCRALDWMLLTKRPENANRMISDGTGRYAEAWLADCKHVWCGASVEHQEAADDRIPHLLRIQSTVRFLSMEPLLGPVSLRGFEPMDLVIVGGESGDGARQMKPEWVRDLRDQCQATGTAFHFKQWGEINDSGVRVGKKTAGRILDGRTWDEMPSVLA